MEKGGWLTGTWDNLLTGAVSSPGANKPLDPYSWGDRLMTKVFGGPKAPSP